MIARLISDFFEKTTPREIRDHEVKNGYKWSTVVPFVKVVYCPRKNRKFSMENHKDPNTDHDSDSAATLDTLAVHCIETGVFSLQNVLQDEEIRDVLVREGLVDYVTSMPWNVPHGTRVHQRSKELVAFLGQHMQLQPPSLVNLSKARLASLYFGLDKVFKAFSVHELVSDYVT